MKYLFLFLFFLLSCAKEQRVYYTDHVFLTSNHKQYLVKTKPFDTKYSGNEWRIDSSGKRYVHYKLNLFFEQRKANSCIYYYVWEPIDTFNIKKW